MKLIKLINDATLTETDEEFEDHGEFSEATMKAFGAIDRAIANAHQRMDDEGINEEDAFQYMHDHLEGLMREFQ